jgi:hypothetical protein
MQAICDLFRAFGPPKKNVTVMAQAVGEKRDTVYRWLRSGRIPETSWPDVIEAAASKGIEVSADSLLRMNKPAGKRGRKIKAKKIRAVRR